MLSYLALRLSSVELLAVLPLFEQLFHTQSYFPVTLYCIQELTREKKDDIHPNFQVKS